MADRDSPVLRQRLAQAGAWLFFVGLVTGLWSAVVLTGKVDVAIPRLALAAHLNGLLGGLWLIAVAWTLDFLRYGERGRRRLAVLVLTTTWGNWLITLIASVLGVRGLEYTGVLANDTVAGLLQLFVVLPGLVGAGAWALGFRAPSPSPPSLIDAVGADRRPEPAAPHSPFGRGSDNPVSSVPARNPSARSMLPLA